jgi:hypothetical protein
LVHGRERSSVAIALVDARVVVVGCDGRSMGEPAAFVVAGSTLEAPSAPLPHVLPEFGFALLAALSAGGFNVGAGCVAPFVRCTSAPAVATPSLEAGAKSGPRLGSFVASSTELEEAAGGGVCDAHAAAAIEPTIK